MPTTDRKLRVFLCHASQDKPVVRELYERLLAEGWIDPWLDEEKLLPGQDWNMEIEKAVEDADIVIVCLSNKSLTKEGYVQKELRFVLDIALEKPEDEIFIIPIRLDNVRPPRRLRSWHYLDYFPQRDLDIAYERLCASMKIRVGRIEQRQELDLSLDVENNKQKKSPRESLVESVVVGGRCTGIVYSIFDSGAIINIKGVKLFMPIVQIAGDIKHPSEVFDVGQKADVEIISVDRSTNKINISYRMLHDSWWATVSKLQEGEVVSGVVTRLVNKLGAFILINGSVEGLVNITELSDHRIDHPKEVLREGENVKVKILKIDQVENRIVLSLRQVVQ